MATEPQSDKAPGSRLLYLVTLLALAIVAAAAFSRVYRGSHSALRLGLVAGAAVLLAVATERRHILLATLVSAIGLTFAVAIVLFPHTMWHGLPTASTLRAAARAWSRIGDVARTEISPARPVPPLFLAGLTAVWAASFSAHALAVRARSPFLALLPPAALLAFPSILLVEGARPLYVLTFLLAALGLLFADATRRVGQWGPISAWQGRHGARLGTVTLRGARWLGVCCVGIAVILPGILPGYRRPGIIDVHSAASGIHIGIDPLVYIQPQLLRSDPVPLFTVTANEPSYWRFAALDTFDGQVWDSKNLDVSSGRDVLSGPLASDPLPDPTSASVRYLTQQYNFQLLSQDWLPAAYNPVEITAGTSLRYDPRSSVLVDPDGTRTGFTYQVRSEIVTPTKAVLDQIESLDTSEARPFLSLPEIPNDIRVLAHQLTDDKPSPYEKILAIQSYLRGFRYDIEAPAGHDVNHMEYFLFRSKAGYCEQFAGTMAVMLRSIGIPARVAVGFTQGSRTPELGKYQVSTQDAHAWVEVLFPKYGWLMFEPTPTRRNPTSSPYDFPPAPLPAGQNTAPCPDLSGHGIPGGPILGGDACEEVGGRQGAQGGGRTGQDQPNPTGLAEGGPAIHRPTSWRIRALQLAGLMVILFLSIIPLTKSLRRRRALRRSAAARDRVLAAYGVLAGRAGDLGMGRGPAETLKEYRARLQERVPGLDGQFDRLTGLAGQAAYSDQAVTDEQAQDALATAQQSWRLIRRAVSPLRRLAAWFWVDRSVLVRWTTRSAVRRPVEPRGWRP